MDARLRGLERRWRTTGAISDEAAWLAARVQAGALDSGRLALAGLLGHEAALLAGAAPLIDPLGGRDEDAWQRVDAFKRTGDVAALRPLLDDPSRRIDCGHAQKWALWLHYLFTVSDEVSGDPRLFFRCWTCGERLLVWTSWQLGRSKLNQLHAYSHRPRGLALLDDLANALSDPDHQRAHALTARRWAWGLGAHELEASLRAGAAAVQLALDHDLPDPTYTPPSPRARREPPPEHGQRRVLDAFRSWLNQPDSEHADRLEALFDMGVDDDGVDTAWVDLLVEAAQSRMTSADDLLTGALARRAVHRACLYIDESIVLAHVRAAFVPWVLGLDAPLA